MIFIYRNVYFLDCWLGARVEKCGITVCIQSPSKKILPGFKPVSEKIKVPVQSGRQAIAYFEKIKQDGPYKEYIRSTGLSCMRDRVQFLSSEVQASALPIIVRNCGWSQWDEGSSVLRQKSDICALELVTEGKLQLFQDGHEYLVNPGDCFILRRNGSHAYSTTAGTGSVKKQFVGFEGDLVDIYISRYLAGVDIVHLPRNEQAHIQSIIDNIAGVMENKATGFEYSLASLSLELLLRVGHFAEKTELPHSVESCLNYMRQNLGEKPDINALLSVANISQRNLFRQFHDFMNDTPMGVLLKMRLKQAKILLACSSKQIKDISRLVGFREVAHFSNAFKKSTGYSPREFIKLFRNNKNMVEIF